MSYATLSQLRGYLTQVPEWGQQLITLTGSPAGGTITLAYEGASAAPLASNATATAVQTALRAIVAIGSTGVKVTGRPGGPWKADFQGVLASDAAPLTLAANGLTGGTAPSVTIAPATDSLLQSTLDRASGIIRDALRAMLADTTFDFVAWGSASTRIVLGRDTEYLLLPPHQAGSVTLVEYQSGINPDSYTALPDQWLEESGRLYRPIGWTGGLADWPRYRVTAVWGYGPTVPDSIIELALELAVNIWRSHDKGGFTEMIGVEGRGAIRMVAGLNKQQQLILDSWAAQLYQPAV